MSHIIEIPQKFLPHLEPGKNMALMFMALNTLDLPENFTAATIRKISPGTIEFIEDNSNSSFGAILFSTSQSKIDVIHCTGKTLKGYNIYSLNKPRLKAFAKHVAKRYQQQQFASK